MNFCDKVKYVRAELLVSQKELAKQLGVTYVTVSRWENQQVEPSFLTQKRFEAFCKMKGIKFDDFNF